MDRDSRETMLMKMALAASGRSTCLRGKVGAVIAIGSRPISSGYCGAPSGLPHCTPETCNPEHPCERTVHAEVNSILFAAKHGIATDGATLYSTTAPCRRCAEAIINAGIKRVVYLHGYRSTDGLDLLKSAGVQTDQWTSISQTS